MAKKKQADDSKAPAAQAAHAPQAAPADDTAAAGKMPTADRPAEDRTAETAIVAYPPPAGMPAILLEGAQLIVKAKSQRGRRRAGYAFTREATDIPLADLSEAQREAIAGDHELVVALRLVKPS